MATYRFAGALTAARWPLLAGLQGRTVINPLYDAGKRAPRFFFGTDESVDVSIPQMIYCENAVPSVEGMNSVGYLGLIGASGNTDFDQCITLRDENENNYLYSPSNGKNYILNPSTHVWTSTNPIAGLTNPQVSRAYVNGRTFVCFANKNVYEYTGGSFLPVGLTLPGGVAVTDIRGIGGSSNYLIIFTDITVYWSSLIDPTDFTPSLTTGAGFDTPQDVRGRITAVQGGTGGFVIWTTRNAVAATFTNNARAPFAFKEIAGAGGITDIERVTQDSSSGAQYAWTSGGLQRVTLQSAEAVSGEINDFLAGRMFCTWDYVNNNIDITPSTLDEFYTKLTIIASRYLCISYGDTVNGSSNKTFSRCLVYDLILKRWGQFKIDHVDVFPISVGTNAGYQSFTDLGTATFTTLGTKTFNDLVTSAVTVFNPTSKRQVAFLQQDGTIQVALMDYNKSYNHTGVLVFGRFQLVRQRKMQHQTTTVEGADGMAVSGANTFQAYLLNSIDGLNMDNGIPFIKRAETLQSIEYGLRKTGMNFCLAFTGTFSLSSFVTEVSQDGDR